MSTNLKQIQVISSGQLAALSVCLRNAFKDMDKLPSGNVTVEHLRLQVFLLQHTPSTPHICYGPVARLGCKSLVFAR